MYTLWRSKQEELRLMGFRGELHPFRDFAWCRNHAGDCGRNGDRRPYPCWSSDRFRKDCYRSVEKYML